MCLFGQVEAVPLPQFDQSLHVTPGLCSEAVGIDLLLQTETKRILNDRKPGQELKRVQMSSEWLRVFGFSAQRVRTDAKTADCQEAVTVFNFTMCVPDLPPSLVRVQLRSAL